MRVQIWTDNWLACQKSLSWANRSCRAWVGLAAVSNRVSWRMERCKMEEKVSKVPKNNAKNETKKVMKCHPFYGPNCKLIFNFLFYRRKILLWSWLLMKRHLCSPCCIRKPRLKEWIHVKNTFVQYANLHVTFMDYFYIWNK